jgi:CRISPR-associated protein Csx14
MAESKIPVDLFNPGQVFACLGFMELAEVLLGDAEAGFDWSDPGQVWFLLKAQGNTTPVEAALDYLASASAERVTPAGYVDPPRKKVEADDEDEADEADEVDEDADMEGPTPAARNSETFPAKVANAPSLPVRLSAPGRPSIELGHWADGSSRNTFKLYSGNRSAEHIARAMLTGTRKKHKGKNAGELEYKGIVQLWQESKAALAAKPFDVLTPLGGSFNFDPRGAWTALDAGYSPDIQKHGVAASPLVNLLAAYGLEHTRPVESGVRQVRYCAWSGLLPVSLARVAFQGGIPSLPARSFRFELALSGKNKVVTFAQQENTHERP